MNTVDGYAMSSWERGYGDFAMVPDLATLRRVPWQPGTALLLADLAWLDGTPVVASPRQILRRQLDRLAEHGLHRLRRHRAGVHASTATPTRRPGAAATATSTPANQYNVDYSMLGTARVEPLLRRIRIEMAGAGLHAGERQGRVQPRPARDRLPLRPRRWPPPTTTSIYKTGAKEIAAQEGMSLTFMAKPNAARGQLLPHPLLAARRATARR